MPAYTRGKLRDSLFWVKIVAQFPIYYGWKGKDLGSITGVADTVKATLGHLETSALPDNAFKIVRARTPKPARFKKQLNRSNDPNVQSSVTTFCSADNYTQAYTDGWDLVSPAKQTNLSTSGKTKSAIAKLTGGYLYAFPLNILDFQEYADDLGLVDAASADVNSEQEQWLVTAGASYPKPGRVILPLANSKVGTFYSTSKKADVKAAGWSTVGDERIFAS